jgi:hypothetical protein
MLASVVSVLEFFKPYSFLRLHRSALLDVAMVAVFAAIGPRAGGRLCSQLSEIASAGVAAFRTMCRDRL